MEKLSSELITKSNNLEHLNEKIEDLEEKLKSS
jgi:hypothetical protein